MAEESFDLAIWEIENFSCWNQALHGKFIESPEIHFVKRYLKVKLYPRGTSGLEDHMVVHFSFNKPKEEYSGDLSFIGADGSTLCTQRVHSKKDESKLELPPGPKYEEVIVKSKENEFYFKDQLTLRLQMKSDDYDEHWACTVIQFFDITVEVDPSVMVRNNEKISYIRHFHDDYDIALYLQVGEIREDKSEEISLALSTTDTFSVKSHLKLLSSAGFLLRYENNEHMFQGEDSWTFSESLTKEEISELKSIILNLKIITGKVSHSAQNVYNYLDNVKILPKSVFEEKSPNIQDVTTHNDPENSSACVLRKELRSLYLDQGFSDLQLKCLDVSFPVHRNILSARSTVFKAMLSTDMTEAASGCVDIGDLDPSTLSRLLAFLYTGAVENLEGESALKLYYAADKYLVPSLKRECVRFLSYHVSVSNVCDVLSLGDKHQDAELTAAAQDFILRKYNEVLKSEEWSSFMCSEPLLAVKTLTHFGTKDFVGNLSVL